MCVDVCVWVCVYAAGAIALFAWAGRVIERSGFRVDTWVPYAFCFFTPYGACAQSIVVCIVLRCLSYWLRSACVTFNTKLIHRRSNLLNSRRPKTYSARVHTCVLACALVDCMRSWPLSSSFEPGSSVCWTSTARRQQDCCAAVRCLTKGIKHKWIQRGPSGPLSF